MSARREYARRILGGAYGRKAARDRARAFMPSNIALIKYWGKRPGDLNLPLVSSLSRTLGDYGTDTEVALAPQDAVEMNGRALAPGDPARQKIAEFLDLFRAPGECYRVSTRNNIPTAAGVASSASGFAALTAALAALKGWDLPPGELSMLARLGSGSAARSFWPGTVLWRKGVRDDGMDCRAEPVTLRAGDFRMAVLLLETGEKPWPSRFAMQASLATSPLARDWPAAQQAHLEAALSAANLETLGAVVEENAVLLHRLMQAATPSITYDTAATAGWKRIVLQWRGGGLPVWFTQDAGPNLKLIFHKENTGKIEAELQSRAVDYLLV